MKKSILASLAAMTMLSCTAAASAEIVSTTPITRATFWGQKVMAVAVEYDEPIAAQEFALDTFYAEDVHDTGSVETQLEMAGRNNARIYTNSEAAMLAEGAAEGNYVIVEFSEDWQHGGQREVGTMYVNYYYTKEDGTTASQARITKPNDGTIQQKADITAKSGTVMAAGEAMGMTNDYIHLDGIDRFELVNIPRENFPDKPYHAYVALPDNYDTSKEYPVMFVLSGMGVLEWQIGDMTNTDVALYNDKQLLTWTETADYGYEDMIVVSMRHTTTPFEGLDVYADTAAAARWIIDNYSIDKDRLFWCGQSYGSFSTFHMLSQYPDVATGFLALNGGVSFSADYSNPEQYEANIAELRECLKPILDNKIKLYIQFGEQDYVGCSAPALYTYEKEIIDYYKNEMGLSNLEISELFRARVMSHTNFLVADGLTDHNVVRLVHWFPVEVENLMNTVFSW